MSGRTRWPGSDPGAFVLIFETDNQAPMVMETEGEDSSYEGARKRLEKFKPLRWCVARLTYEAGNSLLLLDLQRMQKDERPE